MRASKLAFGLVCGPLICCYVVCAACCCPSRLRRCSGSESKKRFERRQKVAPRPLAVRPPERNLTIPVPRKVRRMSDKHEASSESLAGKTLDQTQSRLMRLPFELREMIFRAVVGDKTMHIVLKENKLGHYECLTPHETFCDTFQPDQYLRLRGCGRGTVDSSNIWAPNRKYARGDVTDGDIIPFLQTCRQIYSESIKLLYSTNTFSFHDLDCIRYFSSTILPRRFELVQSLTLEWLLAWPIYDPVGQNILLSAPALYPPHDEATWEATWRIIASMPKLKRLFVGLFYFDGFRDPEFEAQMLAPLMEVTRPKEFKLYPTWQLKAIEGAPFEVVNYS
ncbi:hypothetical protein BU24DRAFT_421613 [Aaosphaeria arxii CBS 175.79]|uniref:DUF7730 domain-containing protein n=1 Tax=Aaosphaeria arxii CBS 175.79 TaxID=1450172 RepID=A0A6A5XQY3_9PLEO|nr:uncharacterized protein BU24DRAFT_421613 [Aaosphaeria arxii CBS 175.79]KAF2015309.1 hypothetical protein BU24DRAFT_421613 [Aaosphaeria arxii CBS 175.79]